MQTGIKSLLAAALVAGLAFAGSSGAWTTARNASVAFGGPSRVQQSARRSPGSAIAPALTVRGALVASGKTAQQAQVQVLADYSGGTGALDVITDATVAPSPVVETLSPGHFRVTFTTSDRLSVGSYRGVVVFRVCSESPCVHVLANTTTSRPYRWTIGWANTGEWETFQRDATHASYVPVAIRAGSIRPLWTWVRDDLDKWYWVSQAVSTPGKVYVTVDTHRFGVSKLYAIDAATGTPTWTQEFQYGALDPPAAVGDRVFVVDAGNNALLSYDANTGALRTQSAYDAQFGYEFAPTVASGVAYVNFLDQVGLQTLSAFATDTGTGLWSASSGDVSRTAPAVADGRVYYYDGAALKVYDAIDGSALASITDPSGAETSYVYYGAPIVGATDSVTAFSGEIYSPDSGWDVEQVSARKLVNFSPSTSAIRWRSTRQYFTHPAVANGVVYSASLSPASLDAIDEATGAILWSWAPGAPDSGFHRNVVVTRNLVFASTDRAVYAVDLATHKAVWSSPTPGELTITGDGLLVITEGATQSTGRVLAFKLY